VSERKKKRKPGIITGQQKKEKPNLTHFEKHVEEHRCCSPTEKIQRVGGKTESRGPGGVEEGEENRRQSWKGGKKGKETSEERRW